jgi:3-oxoacyl-[acyl-carrier-protein] synthase-3
MGAVIKQLYLKRGATGDTFLGIGTESLSRCLSQSGIGPDKVEMMINTGVFAEGYIHEPAYAALFQGGLQRRFQGDSMGIPSGMFSFDLHDSGGGMIMATRVVNGFMETGNVSNGLIVAGDAEPVKEGSVGFKIALMAGALLLTKGDPGCGFSAFRQDIYPEYADDFTSYTHHLNGKIQLIVKEKDSYAEHGLECIHRSLRHFLEELGMQMFNLDLLITSQSPKGTAEGLDRTIPGNRVLVPEKGTEVYSAGILYGLDQSIRCKYFERARRILFITIGPGITVNMALYMNI